MKKAVLYARAWPSDEQAKEKIAKQIDLLKSYCEREKIIVWDIYEDVTESYTWDCLDFLGKINGVSSGRGHADLLLVVDVKLFAKSIIDTVITTNLFRETELQIWHLKKVNKQTGNTNSDNEK